MIKKLNILEGIRFFLFSIAIFSLNSIEFTLKDNLYFKIYVFVILFFLFSSIVRFFILNFLNVQVEKFLILLLHLDLFFILLLLFLSGAKESPLIFLLAYPVFVSGFFLRKSEIYYFFFASYLLYIILIVISFILRREVFFTKTTVSNILITGISLGGIGILLAYLKDFAETAKMELVKKEERYRELSKLFNTVVEKSRDAFVFFNEDGEIFFSNKSFKQYFKEPEKFKSEISIENLLENGGITKEIESDGRIFLVKGEEIEYKSEKTFFFIITDITREKIIEHKKRVEEKLKTLGEAAAGLAHEIRNPLASLSASVQFLNENKNVKLIKKLTPMIIKDIKRISEIIEDFLSTTENKEIKIEEVSVKEVLKDVILEMKDEVKINHLKLVSDIRVEKILINRYHLYTLLKNLISNAIKAVKDSDKGEVVIQIVKESDNILITVMDNGVGIDSKNVNRVMEPFFSNFSSGGTGIGMVVVKRISDFYNGSITIERENGWTVFRVKLKEKKDEDSCC